MYIDLEVMYRICTIVNLLNLTRFPYGFPANISIRVSMRASRLVHREPSLGKVMKLWVCYFIHRNLNFDIHLYAHIGAGVFQ